ncbi:hypothetical protein OKJ48_38750 [Streptomyces kunmingensis]|uniref:Uncharacterized protein n=1 Tax=Streptomyces kunmingensis TaxID=68225 RepID=A0ABU6CN67_9ACTN|nr:hypothetical protein [Streptomyces kunmingensis]MEB3966123.1 hypothetical protein [Streptomyces kunmingensis]
MVAYFDGLRIIATLKEEFATAPDMRGAEPAFLHLSPRRPTARAEAGAGCGAARSVTVPR